VKLGDVANNPSTLLAGLFASDEMIRLEPGDRTPGRTAFAKTSTIPPAWPAWTLGPSNGTPPATLGGTVSRRFCRS